MQTAWEFNGRETKPFEIYRNASVDSRLGLEQLANIILLRSKFMFKSENQFAPDTPDKNINMN